MRYPSLMGSGRDFSHNWAGWLSRIRLLLEAGSPDERNWPLLTQNGVVAPATALLGLS